MALLEAEKLKNLRHPNLVQFDGYVEEVFDGSQCLLMLCEYCPVSNYFLNEKAKVL